MAVLLGAAIGGGCSSDSSPGPVVILPNGCITDPTNCPVNTICDRGDCVASNGACNSTDDCASGQICNVGYCVNPGGCDTDADCGAGQECKDGSCVAKPTPGQ
jgi:hypothetical protein